MQLQQAFLASMACALVTLSGRAQTLTRVTSQVGSPGDTVVLTGTNLGATTVVRFGASVGGFAGFMVRNVAPVQVTATSVTAVVPLFGNFLPPGVLGSSPVGTVDAGGTGFANSLPFFYLEQTAGQISTGGLGTTWGGFNALRPVAGFTIAGGAPVAGNQAFTLTLEGAIPGAVVAAVVGVPSPPPLTTYLDGLVGIDLTQPYVYVQPNFYVNPAGDVFFHAPIPATPLNVTVTVVWVIASPFGNPLGISDGLTVVL